MPISAAEIGECSAVTLISTNLRRMRITKSFIAENLVKCDLSVLGNYFLAVLKKCDFGHSTY
jgi:hypothetical protein